MYSSKSRPRPQKNILKHCEGYTIKEAAKCMTLLLSLPEDTYDLRTALSYLKDSAAFSKMRAGRMARSGCRVRTAGWPGRCRSAQDREGYKRHFIFFINSQ